VHRRTKNNGAGGNVKAVRGRPTVIPPYLLIGAAMIAATARV
jgi:hypothetical protein